MRFPMQPNPRPEGVSPRLLKNANIPRRFWTAQLDQVPNELPHKRVIAEFIRAMHKSVEDGRGLLLYGKAGVGKTALACIVLREVMARGPNKVWFEVAHDIDHHARRRDATNDDGNPVWDLVNYALYAVIDDLGAHRDSKLDEGWIERVLRERYNHQLPTIITSNLAPDDLFKARTGVQAIVAETCEIVEVGGDSWR